MWLSVLTLPVKLLNQLCILKILSDNWEKKKNHTHTLIRNAYCDDQHIWTCEIKKKKSSFKEAEMLVLQNEENWV